MPNDNPFLSYLEDRPGANYFSYQNQWRTPNMKRFFQGQFSNIQNQYLGQLSQWVRGGSQGQPQQFSDFLRKINWGQNFQQQAPQESARFNPFTRWLT